MSCRAIRIGSRQCVRVQDVVNHIATTKRVSIEYRASPSEAHIGFVGENPEEYPTAGDIRHRVRYGLSHGVDRVRPHRVANIDDEVGHDVGAARYLHQPHDEVLHPPPRVINIGSCSFAVSIKDERSSRSRSRAACGSATSTT